MFLLKREGSEETVSKVVNFGKDIVGVKSFLRIPLRRVHIEDRFLEKYLEVKLVYSKMGIVYIYFTSELKLEDLEQRIPLPIRIEALTRKTSREIENEVLQGEFSPEKYLDSGFFDSRN